MIIFSIQLSSSSRLLIHRATSATLHTHTPRSITRHLIHTPFLTSLHLCLQAVCYSSEKLLWVRKKCLFKFTTEDASEKISLFYCWCTSFFLMGSRTREQERKFFSFFHSTQASTFSSTPSSMRVCASVQLCTRVIVQVCVCVCADSQQPFPPPLLCALSLYHHIFPWQINFTHDQPTPLAALGPAVIKRREITIYIILMQTSFSR